MSVQTDPMPPVPDNVPPVDEKTATKKFSTMWLRWFLQVKFKIDAINESLVSISNLLTLGFVTQATTGTWVARVIRGTLTKINVTNGDGIAGDPVINLIPTAVTPGSYTSTDLTVDQDGRITAAANGSGGGDGYVGGSKMGAAGQTLGPVTGLSLDTDHVYIIDYSTKLSASSTIYLVLNGDTTLTNYWRQYVFGTGTSVGGARANDSLIGNIATATVAGGTIKLWRDLDNNVRFENLCNIGALSAVVQEHTVGGWLNSADVTSIAIYNATVNLNINSTMRVYKRKGGAL